MTAPLVKAWSHGPKLDPARPILVPPPRPADYRTGDEYHAAYTRWKRAGQGAAEIVKRAHS